jgi:hypothetical protein
VEVNDAALKHGVRREDALQAANEYVAEIELDDDPRRVLRLGFDTTGRLLETVILETVDARLLVIHAMRARRHYIDELL